MAVETNAVGKAGAAHFRMDQSGVGKMNLTPLSPFEPF
jgi:hypothetical protein